jgi:hypothetical protein
MDGESMGASGWDYRVPYQADIAAALEELRWQVYHDGTYYKKDPDSTLDMSDEEYRATLPGNGDDDDIGTFLLEEWRKAKMRPAIDSPDTLMANQPGSGTHSIIDMCDGVSDAPKLFTVSPLTDAELLSCFGTLKPTGEQVGAGATLGDRTRWQGAYVISYDDDTPSEIHFYGFSGD